MVLPVCPLCKAQDNEYCFSERNYDLKRCNNCELFFIEPYPEDVHNIVSEYSYDELEIVNPEKHYLASVQFQKRYFNMIEQEVRVGQSILDVGCGTGHLLERLGIYPDLLRVGIELNTDRAKMARQITGLEIWQVPIEEFSTNTKFDVITMINVLSHISSFDKLFAKLRSLLQPNGKLILKVGEFRRDFKKSVFFDWDIPDHLHFLGFNTINFICRKYGWKICKHQRVPRSRDLFSPTKFRTPGRSAVRNIIKRLILYTPFALPILARCYSVLKGQKIYSSFIVLSPTSSS